MSEALPLPPRPNLEQYKKLAKDFQRACRSSNAPAIRDWATRWVETLAGLRGLEITAELRRQLQFEADGIARRWHKLKKTNERAERCALADAQFFIAREHGFASWPKFAKHLESLARANSPASKFESAVDAIVNGDLATLKKRLTDDPELVRARSAREHRSTLLHYVSANGVEDFRQKTPHNIVEITRLLLGAGADVNAESDAYGGRSTTLGLTATSWHPEKAGVQLELMELLLEHGAAIDGPGGDSAVNGCLRNGRGKAAEFLTIRGVRLDLEGAAGVGRLDVVKSFFNDDGSLRPPATQNQIQAGFAWACEFGRTEVVEFLLARGIDVSAMTEPMAGATGLHWAAFAGHADIVRLLLKRGAPVDVKDRRHNGTPLEWALYGWTNSPHKAARTDD
ncbi:MAG TPA: ankyrin repeat domain-containing protein, partial [Planctomycetaceae bacterium]|nr:ankyrin repeat domain-containing protein [Planctomycetaceae bacterium]